MSFTLFCTFSMSVSSVTAALFTLSHVTRGFIVIPWKRTLNEAVVCVVQLNCKKYKCAGKLLWLNNKRWHLENDSEVHDDERGADHQILLLYLVLIQHHSQPIRNSPSQATVAHNHLIYEPNGDQPVPVQDPGEEKDTCRVHAHRKTP